MNKKIIPFPANLPLSTAIVHNAKFTMEISGQIGLDPVTNKLAESIELQTENVIKAIENTLSEVGWTLQNIVKTRIFLTDMEDYAKMNEVYAKFFSKEFPARFALAVKALPLGAKVEIECTAVGDDIQSQEN